MGIIDRAQAVFASNFNALLDKFEEPGRDLALLLSEMKEQILQAQRDLIRVVGQKKVAESRLSELDAEISTWEKRAELAVRQGDDGLAREALAQKQRLAAERERLNVARAEQQQTAIGMKAVIERMKRTHQDYSARQHTIATELSQARAGGGPAGLGAKPGANSFEAFERIENEIGFEAAEVAAQVEIDQMLDQTALGQMSRAELDERFRALEQVAPDDSATIEPAPSEGGEVAGSPRIRIEQ